MDQVWEFALFGLGCALAGAAFPAALAWRQSAIITHVRELLASAQVETERLRRELFHTTKTRIQPWPFPPKLPEPNGHDQ